MKLKEEINMNRLVMNLFNNDLEILRDKKMYNLDDVSFHELKMASDGNDINSILLVIDRLFKKATSEQNADHIIFLSYFLYRYIYFYKTLVDWDKFVDNNSEIVMSDLGSMFIDNLAPFFDKQIDFFIDNYTKYLEDVQIKTLSQKLSDEIYKLINLIQNSNGFDQKLSNVEELVRYFQDSRNLTCLLEGEINDKKEVFLTVTNEIKVDFQSMNNLISEVLKKIREMRID